IDTLNNQCIYIIEGGSPPEKLVLFVRDNGSKCPRSWFYSSEIFNSLADNEYVVQFQYLELVFQPLE
ncbi:hypothetical protein, partial [Pseudalkalibacillus decolorationis]|uniref:hypothetical protein n=1 Tax=Pseudalkalibacillus decolorationis TaxID=163879 RepID=UPI00214912C2